MGREGQEKGEGEERKRMEWERGGMEGMDIRAEKGRG
jgi:hypothetical protein